MLHPCARMRCSFLFSSFSAIQCELKEGNVRGVGWGVATRLTLFLSGERVCPLFGGGDPLIHALCDYEPPTFLSPSARYDHAITDHCMIYDHWSDFSLSRIVPLFVLCTCLQVKCDRLLLWNPIRPTQKRPMPPFGPDIDSAFFAKQCV